MSVRGWKTWPLPLSQHAWTHRVNVVLRESLLSCWDVVLERQHSHIYAGLIRRRNADAILHRHGTALDSHTVYLLLRESKNH